MLRRLVAIPKSFYNIGREKSGCPAKFFTLSRNGLHCLGKTATTMTEYDALLVLRLIEKITVEFKPTVTVNADRQVYKTARHSTKLQRRVPCLYRLDQPYCCSKRRTITKKIS